MSKKLKLKVGKTYLNGHGNKITITNKIKENRLYKYERALGSTYTKEGYYYDKPSLNDLVSEYIEPVERDLSGVQHILDLLVPEVRERVIELANDPKCMHSFDLPNDFISLFIWNKTDEDWKYWCNIDYAIDDKSLRENNPAFIQPFKWIRDRMPTVLDADESSDIAIYNLYQKNKLDYCHWSHLSFPLCGWAKTEDVKQFTKDNPAPHPLTNQ